MVDGGQHRRPGRTRSEGHRGDRVRVLHVITRLELGGAQRNTLYTVGNLDRSTFDVALAWGPGDVLDREAAELDGVRRYPVPDLVRPVSPLRDLHALLQLSRVMARFRPDVVHTHSSKAGIVGRCAARLRGVAVVVHSIHGFGFTPLQPAPRRALFRAVERLVARWTDHFVAVSRNNASLGVEMGLFRQDAVTVIRSGIELARYREAQRTGRARRRLGISDGVPMVTQLGNFKPQKAPLDFVRMADTVAARVPDVRFVMAGDGPLRSDAEDLARDLGVDDRIVFCGWWEEVPELLTDTDLSVLTSHHEGLPRAVVESLAAGVPVVATAVDGTPEVVHHDVNGLLVPAGDVEALSTAVSDLLLDRSRLLRLASAAGEGLEDFDIDLMVRQQEELYRCLYGHKPS